jgi:hypothetical protein
VVAAIIKHQKNAYLNPSFTLWIKVFAIADWVSLQKSLVHAKSLRI